MATRSSIIMKTEDEHYKGVYCHCDGYLSYNGVLLHRYYQTPLAVSTLISGGSISSLGKTTCCPKGHTWRNRIDGHTLYYIRDGGQSFRENSPYISYDLEHIMDKLENEYNYLFIDGKWYVNGSDNYNISYITLANRKWYYLDRVLELISISYQ